MGRMLMVLAWLCLACVPAGAQAVSLDPKLAPTGRYVLEKAHSQLLFAIRHEGLDDYYGRFNRLSGTMNFDAHEPEKSALNVTVDTSSIDVQSQALVETLAGRAVFDSAQFPSATFRSTAIVRTGQNTGRITGDLTIKNITKPVTLDVTFNGGRLNPLSDAYALGFSATTTIKRTDFGLTGMVWEPFVGDDVKLIIEAMFQQQKE